jgi:hypothetical protein
MSKGSVERKHVRVVADLARACHLPCPQVEGEECRIPVAGDEREAASSIHEEAVVVIASRERNGADDAVRLRVDHGDNISGLHGREHHPRARVVLDVACISSECDGRDPAPGRVEDGLDAARLVRDEDVPLDRVECESVRIAPAGARARMAPVRESIVSASWSFVADA